MRVCGFTSVCQEDECWLDQYLVEASRLGMDVAVHFDRCDQELKDKVSSHPFVVATTAQDDRRMEFDERHKQLIFEEARQLNRYDWLMAWDVDETYEKDAVSRMADLDAACLDWDCVDVKWVNLWGSPRFIRVDGGFGGGHRVKFYNLRGGRMWHFNHPITNGAKLVTEGGKEIKGRTAKHPLVCLHWGMMTPELRRFHKERWDRIYSTALKGDPNPYGFWKWAIESESEAVVVRNPYL